MEPAETWPDPISDPPPRSGRWKRFNHRLAMVLLLACPAWWAGHVMEDFFTFGKGLTEEEPSGIQNQFETTWESSGVLMGYHPLHIYHAWIGAGTFATSNKVSAYDPKFHAGYLKTPLFDSAARPLESFLSLFMWGNPPTLAQAARAQGWLVGTVVLLTPFIIGLSARWAGMARCSSVVSGLMAMLVMALTAWRESLTMGAVDRLAGAPLVLAHLGLLLHYHRHPSPLALVGLGATTALCWLFDPLLTLVSLPVQLWIYLRTGMKHGAGWHTGLLLACSVGVLLNISYLISWQKYWWIRVAPRWENAFFPKGILQSLLRDPAWGESWETLIGLWIIGLGLLGGLTTRASGRRLQSAVFSIALGGVLTLYGLGQAFMELGRWDTGSLLPAILLVACIPAGGVLAGLPIRGRLKRVDPEEPDSTPPRRWWAGRIPAILSLAILGLLIATNPSIVSGLSGRVISMPSVRSPLSEAETACVSFLSDTDPAKGRILWEMVPGDERRNWALMLPEWSGHSLVGGLDSIPRIEHMQAGLFEGRLAGRPLKEWTAESFLAYCRTYQIAWVAVRSEASVLWMDGIPGVVRVHSGDPGTGVPVVFALTSPGENVALVGSARLVSADAGRLVFADVVPSRGQVVLSFHYQTGLVASPGRVEVERELDYRDPIPLIRLRMDEPATRLQLRWLPP